MSAIKWVVTEFSRDRLVGVVKRGVESFLFHSTSFQSDTCFRDPVVGESVEVVFNQSGTLLSVHGK